MGQTPSGERPARSDAELQAAAHHVQYEVDSYRLILEALLLHFRNLLNFFEPGQPKEQDVLAQDYVRRDADLGHLARRLERHRFKLNGLLSHLSYVREDYVERKKDAMKWPIDEMTEELGAAWRRFLELLGPERRAWFVSEHRGEIEIVISPPVTISNPLSDSR